MTLRLVGKGSLRPSKVKSGPRHESTVLTPDEQRKARQALHNLKDAFGTWACLAEVMGMNHKVLMTSIGGR
jgi:hypothetical protein